MIISFDEGISVAGYDPKDANWRKNPNAVLCKQLLHSLLADTKLPVGEFVNWLETNTTFRFNPPIDTTTPNFENTNIISIEVDDKEFVFYTLKYVKEEDDE